MLAGVCTSGITTMRIIAVTSGTLQIAHLVPQRGGAWAAPGLCPRPEEARASAHSSGGRFAAHGTQHLLAVGMHELAGRERHGMHRHTQEAGFAARGEQESGSMRKRD